MLKTYAHQKDIIEQSLATDKNVLIMLPTGGGKTHIASEIAQKSKKVLFLAPKINLLEQTIESFAHLDPQLIHSSSNYDPDKNVFVSTIQTISRRPHLLTEMDFDTIIIDEVHFGDNGKMQEVIKSHHNGRFIGLSATPYDSLGNLIDGYEVILKKYDMKYLIEEGYLTPVEAVCPFSVDLKGIKTTGGDYNLKELDYKMSSPGMIAATVNATTDILKDKNKTIVFCVSIEHAEKLAKSYRKVFRAKGIKKNVKTLHSKIKKELGKKNLEDFSDGDVDVLISVDMITTGLNVPAIDSMVIARPTKSQNLYKQMVGRGTRKFKGKKYCLMIDCGNIVENLGMPLEPIKPIKKKGVEVEKKKRYCPVCRSTKTKRVVADGKGGLIRICGECGKDEEPYHGNQINKCPECTFMHTYSTHQKHYIINQFGIALKCKGCASIDPLSFFRINSNEFLGSGYGVAEALTLHTLAYKTVFFEECFIKNAIEIIRKKEKTYTKILFGTKKIDQDEVFQEIRGAMEYDNYMKCLVGLSVFDLRKLFVEFCYKYTQIPKSELEYEIFKREEVYFEENRNYMGAEMYRKAAIKHVNFHAKNNKSNTGTVDQ